MRTLLLLLLVSLPACFNPETPICTFACGPGGACPDDYECRADNYCHRKGTTGECGFTDASMPADAGGDQGVPDLSMPDLGNLDLQSTDLEPSDASIAD